MTHSIPIKALTNGFLPDVIFRRLIVDYECRDTLLEFDVQMFNSNDFLVGCWFCRRRRRRRNKDERIKNNFVVHVVVGTNLHTSRRPNRA